MTTDEKSRYRDDITKYNIRLHQIASELSDLEVKKEELESEAANIRKILPTLRELVGQPNDPNDLSSQGFTDAVRSLFRDPAVRLSPANVKDALAQRGFPISRYSNPMASIYKILERLHKGDELALTMVGFNVMYNGKRKMRKGKGKRFGLKIPATGIAGESQVKGVGNEPQPTTTTNKAE